MAILNSNIPSSGSEARPKPPSFQTPFKREVNPTPPREHVWGKPRPIVSAKNDARSNAKSSQIDRSETSTTPVATPSGKKIVKSKNVTNRLPEYLDDFNKVQILLTPSNILTKPFKEKIEQFLVFTKDISEEKCMTSRLADGFQGHMDACGPDGICERVIEIEEAQIIIRGSVLALRGHEVVQQPLQSEDGRLLMLWNGEIFDSLVSLDPFANDGLQLLDRLTKSLQGRSNEQEIVDEISRELSSIEGPFAFVVYDSKTKILSYNRDTLGRRSLLQSCDTDEGLLLCSAVSIEAARCHKSFCEVDCDSFWMVKGCTAEMKPIRVPRWDTNFTRSHRIYELSVSVESDVDEDHVSCFLKVLSESVQKRVSHIRIHGSKQDAQVAILFSGGLDCTTLALLAHQHIDACQPIDLLNVAFENPRVLQAKAKSDSQDIISSIYDVPDRITGRQSYQELQRLAPDRKWNFVEVNVSHQEYLMGRPIVESLMMPCTSVMDLSIASALYFASGGKGSNGYTSTAKVLLSGLGADELLGGYSRHRKAFSAGGRQALIEELQMDLDRLATRNLGRDDRILSSSGKEARYPFLSHSVINFLSNLPIEIKMDFASLPAGQGDKMLLRRAAAHLGLNEASLLVKRAIQFGARSAKMEIGQGKVLGHELLKG